MRAELFKHVPNGLTLLRLVSIIPMLFLMYSPFENRFLYALIIFCVVMPTDVLDGFIARRFNQTSDFGGFLDPLSDKVVSYVMLFSLFKLNVYPSYLIFPMFIRDILVDGLRNYVVKQGRVLPANISGKLKLLCQAISIIFGFLYLHFESSKDSFFYAAANLTLACAFLVSLWGIPILYKAATSWKTSE